MSGSYDPEFARWLATPSTQGVLVETMQFIFHTGAATIRIANRRFSPFVAIDELGIPRTYRPLPFTKSRPAIRNSTEMSITSRVDGVDGVLLRALSVLTSDDLRKEVHVVLRDYIDPIMVDRPCREPIRLRLDEAKVGVDVVELTMSSASLPNRRAGLYYDLSRFPGLRQ